MLVSDARAFAALEEEWDALYDDAPAATPFQSWACLYSWWEHYGEGRFELRLILVRAEGGLLVGALPLALERRPFGRLLFLGTGTTGYPDILAREGFEEAVARAGARALRGMDSWSVADLRNLRPGASAWGLFDRWNGPRASVREDLSSPVIDVGSGGWNELLASLDPKSRSNARRAMRRAQNDGAYWEPVGPEATADAARRLVALHRESWRGRDITAEHLTRRWEGYVVATANRLAQRDAGAVYELRKGEEVLASRLLVFDNGFVGSLAVGASHRALRRYQISSLLMYNAVDVAVDRGVARFDMMHGEEPYKLKWCTGMVPKHRAILGRSRAVWAPYAGYHALRSRARRYARRRIESKDTPRWAAATTRAALRAYRALNRKARRA